MCSIEGFTGNDHGFSIEEMAEFNKERGPDGTNFYKTPEVSMAHSLLQISPNKLQLQQPLVNHSSGDVLSYNGEIYGLPDDVFDSQWLFDLIQNESVAGLKYGVNGMWAFAYYEPTKYRITLCRDHWGIKPLYYMEIDGDLFWSSTPKPLCAILNHKYGKVQKDTAGTRIFQDNDRFLFGELTPYKYIKKLAVGEIKTWDLKSKKFLPSDTMWGAGTTRWNLNTNLHWDPDEFEETMIRCINEVCHAPGIPKAISLSGGLDSTLIASLARDQDNLMACSLGFEDRKNYWESTNSMMFDESKLAARTAKILKLKHSIKMCPHDYNDNIQASAWALGVPMWDRARTVPRYLNVTNAHENGAKIYIVGDLADELVSGYNGDYDYFNDNKPYLTKQILDSFSSKSKKWNEIKRYHPTHLMGDDGINNKLFTRMMMHADGFNTTVDHFCGHYGIESRVPFLHQDLSKYLLKIPSAWKLHVPWEIKDPSQRRKLKGIYKFLFRDLMKSHIPKHIRSREDKAGFAVPWNARNRSMNNIIGMEDVNLHIQQANTYRKFGVDVNPVFKDNTNDIVFNLETGDIELED